MIWLYHHTWQKAKHGGGDAFWELRPTKKRDFDDQKTLIVITVPDGTTYGFLNSSDGYRSYIRDRETKIIKNPATKNKFHVKKQIIIYPEGRHKSNKEIFVDGGKDMQLWVDISDQYYPSTKMMINKKRIDDLFGG